MKILYMCGFYPEIGGPFTNLKFLLIKLAKKGLKLKVLSPLPKNYDGSKLVFVKQLPFEVKYLEEDLPRFIFPSFSFKFINEIKNAKDFDIIHFSGLFDFYSLVSLFLDKKMILSLHGAFMKEAYKMKFFKRIKKNIFMKMIGKRILEKTSFICLASKEEEKHFLGFYPQFKNKIRTIPHGIDVSDHEVNKVENNLSIKYPELKNSRIILFLGRINWIKGIDILLPAFANLKKEYGNIKLLLAGTDDGDNYIYKIKKMVQKENIEDYVIFTGFLTGAKKIEAFKIADIFVLPSYSENFGIAAVEAMTSGCPVVISNKVGIYKEVEENKAGVIVETHPESLYKGIKTLLDNETLRREISENAKKMVKEYYDIDKVADRMIEVYEEIIKSKDYGLRDKD